MNLTVYQIDAFTKNLFSGNPAAIIPLKNWIDESLMQKIAMENNLAETAFFVQNGKHYDLRWFTPVLEINLCGHATLATAYVLYNFLDHADDNITFHTKSGPLTVTKKEDMLLMDFPSWKPAHAAEYPGELAASLGNPEIVAVYKSREWIVELYDEDAVRTCEPDFSRMKKIREMIIITAPGKGVDFVSRFFAPNAGIDEDPVTGSAHSQLIPFWSEKLGKKKMSAKQLSRRSGELYCEDRADRVIMGGYCAFYMKGEIIVDSR